MRVNDIRGFDFGLGETADMLRDSVRDFADDKITPRADEIDRSNTFPRDLWPELGKLGVHGITVEEEWGGGSAISSTAWRWRKSRAPPLRSGSPTARIRTFASTSSAATATTTRSADTFPS